MKTWTGEEYAEERPSIFWRGVVRCLDVVLFVFGVVLIRFYTPTRRKS